MDTYVYVSGDRKGKGKGRGEEQGKGQRHRQRQRDQDSGREGDTFAIKATTPTSLALFTINNGVYQVRHTGRNLLH